MSLPALRVLRDLYPTAHITLIGSHYSGPIFQSCSYIDRLILLDHYENRTRYLRELLALRKERPDLILDFQDAGRSRVQTLVIGGRRRIGLSTRRAVARAIYTDQVPLDQSSHVTRRFANLLGPLGVPTGKDMLPGVLELGATDRAQAEELLQRHRFSEPFVFLQVTSGERPNHRIWPAERFAEVADHLTRNGFKVVIASSLGQDVVQQVIEASHLPVHSISEPLDTLVLAALIERADLYVGYNTGPMHIAAALGVKIVALFDVPTDAVEWYPATAAPCRIVRAKPYPEPPGWRLDTIEAEEVIEAVDSLKRSNFDKTTMSNGFEIPQNIQCEGARSFRAVV